MEVFLLFRNLCTYHLVFTFWLQVTLPILLTVWLQNAIYDFFEVLEYMPLDVHKLLCFNVTWSHSACRWPMWNTGSVAFFELHSPALLTEFFFFYHGRKHRTQILPSLPFLSVQFTSVYSYRRDQSPEFYLVKLKLHKLNNTFLPPLLGTNYHSLFLWIWPL